MNRKIECNRLENQALEYDLAVHSDAWPIIKTWTKTSTNLGAPCFDIMADRKIGQSARSGSGLGGRFFIWRTA
jgi:hypothetical protein